METLQKSLALARSLYRLIFPHVYVNEIFLVTAAYYKIQPQQYNFIIINLQQHHLNRFNTTKSSTTHLVPRVSMIKEDCTVAVCACAQTCNKQNDQELIKIKRNLLLKFSLLSCRVYCVAGTHTLCIDHVFVAYISICSLALYWLGKMGST